MAISSAVPQLTRADARGQGIWGATGSFGGVPRGSRAESARFRIKRGKSNIKRGHIWRKVLAFGSKRGESTSRKHLEHFRGALGVRLVTSFSGRPPPLPDSHGWYGIAGPRAQALSSGRRQGRMPARGIGLRGQEAANPRSPTVRATRRGASGRGRVWCSHGDNSARPPASACR